jgi:ring-1,2-phenylacetyl-CoA epoxidase subunit PaaD
VVTLATGRGVTTTPSPDAASVRAVLDRVPDPELPMVAITDLGMVHDVTVTADGIRVALLPTFVGCPALERIAASVRDALAPFGRPVLVESSFAVPWTSDRITPAGRVALQRAGIAPPGAGADLRCPHCGSDAVALDNLFGPTQCRSVHYCRSCRQPFEALKDV